MNQFPPFAADSHPAASAPAPIPSPTGAGAREFVDRPIIFSAPMVRALLAGTKTQTRRLASSPLRKCEVGDRLYVRENCRAIELDSGTDCFEFQATMDHEDDEIQIENTLEASDLWGKLRQYGRRKNGPLIAAIARDGGGIAGPWVPCIHMPRSISRLTLIVQAVDIEPLLSIDADDAIAEGIHRWPFPPDKPAAWKPTPDWNIAYEEPAAAYRALWNSLHTKDSERWEANPFVVALTFRVVHGNIDEVAK